MPTFAIHGDPSPLAGAETIETRDALARFMFVTIEPGAPGEVWIRSVAPHELASFSGPLYQIDKAADETIILRQARVQLWPFGPGGDSLDEILQAAFEAFYASLAAPNGGWHAKERDCVNRFVMSHLVPACTPGSVLHDPAQIGIESAVKQPTGIGQRRTSPADIAIWSRPHENCWSPEMSPVAAPLAVVEWKVDRPGKTKQKPDGDREWLTRFTEQNEGSLGYSVLVDFAEGGVLRRLTVSRCEGGEWSEGWFERPARET